MGPEEMQEKDDTLQRVRLLASDGQVTSQRGTGRVSFLHKKGLLWRVYTERKGAEHKQLVVPQPLCYVWPTTRPWRDIWGQGRRGTECGVFYWLGMCIDVRRYCASCDTCQRTMPKGSVRKVPLGRMAIVNQPFKNVVVDLIGPIHPTSNKGNRPGYS